MAGVDFRRDVIERSRTVPVLVDFWASWCGPCRILGPILEDLARHAGGRWELVKLDTEEQPEIAQDFGIQSIPAVKLFHRGEVLAEFVGALPAAHIRAWLDAHLPDPRADRLDALMEGWDTRGYAEIVPELEAWVGRDPGFAPASLRLAQAVVGSDPARARDLVNSANVSPELIDLATDVSSLAELMEGPDDAPARIAPHLDEARSAIRRHDLRAALEHLVEAAALDKGFADGLARRAAVALFRLLGHDHELTEEYRPRLSMAIHS